MMDHYEKRDELLFLTAYTLWLISAVLSITLWQRYDAVDLLCEYFRKTAYLLLVGKFLLKRRYTDRDVVGVLVIIFVCAVTAHSDNNKQLLPVVLFVYSAAGIRFEKILKVTFIVQTAIMVLTVAGSQLGLIRDLMWYEGERARHSLGYDYCGYPAHLLLFMTLMWVCIRKKAHFIDCAVLLAVNYVMYLLTDSRTDFYLSVLGIAGFFVWERTPRLKAADRARNFLSRFGFHIACVLSIAVHWIYDPQNPVWLRMNQTLNNRLQLGYDAIHEYGFSLFGENIKWYGQGSLRSDPTRVYNYVDCAFLKETLTFGLLFLCLLAVGYYLAGRKAERRGDILISWAVLISLAYSVINAHLCVLTFNVFILLLSAAFEADELPLCFDRMVTGSGHEKPPAAERIQEGVSENDWQTTKEC